MAEDPMSFRAFSPVADGARLTALLDEALATVGCNVLDVQEAQPPRGFRRRYATGSGGVLPCQVADEAKWTDGEYRLLMAWSFGPLQAVEVEALSIELFLDVIAAACIATDATLGRTCHASGLDRITAAELQGAVDMMTWVQYFGPSISARLGCKRLHSAPFHSVAHLANEAHLARTTHGPGDTWPWSMRRPLMDLLGLAPRRLYIGRGQDEEIRWCGESAG
jgi:hypothetical protein